MHKEDLLEAQQKQKHLVEFRLLQTPAAPAIECLYQVVAYLTRKALESGKTIHQISLLDLKRAAEEVLQKPIPISQQEFDVAVDPLKTVQNRRVPGGPSPPSMRSQLAELRARAKKHERFIATAEKAQERTEQRLLNQVRRLT